MEHIIKRIHNKPEVIDMMKIIRDRWITLGQNQVSSDFCSDEIRQERCKNMSEYRDETFKLENRLLEIQCRLFNEEITEND